MIDTPQVTICIPVAPHHEKIMERALNSAKEQTVQCVIKWIVDKDERGAGAMRNLLLHTVTTPYIVFLDADDWIAENFVEECLKVIQPTHYAYTDWWQGPEHTKAPERPWCNGSWHVITSLLYTQDVKAIGGFDESLAALEDTDFYLRMTTERQVCGLHVQRPLFYYSKDGQRSQKAIRNGDAARIKSELLTKYGGRMGCCGGKSKAQDIYPTGEKQPGDVLAMAMWRGNRPVMGMVTGRVYPRLSYPRTTWVDPEDIDKRPQEWQRVPQVAIDEPTRYEGIEGLAQAMDEGGMMDIREADYTPIVATEKPSPNVETIIGIARGRLK